MKLRQHQPGRFDTFLFADYSGAESEASQRSAIALFRLDTGDAHPRKVPGPFTRANLRTALVEQLQEATAAGRRVLFGIDHQWSWPRDLIAAAGLAGAGWREALSKLATGHGAVPPLAPASQYARAFNEATGQPIFHSRVRTLARKYGIPFTSTWTGNAVRFVETLMPGAKPTTRLGGTGAVAGQTLAGLRELHLLIAELDRREIPFRAWPFDAIHDDGSTHVGCEIYPGHCKRELGERGRVMTRAEWSEHERDAALTCVWAREAPLAELLDLRGAPHKARQIAQTEGWILGARLVAGFPETAEKPLERRPISAPPGPRE